jgi:hypothetical protein
MYDFKYLHEPTPGTIVLDHRLTPEVRAMFAAMVSRSPIGGMKQRYTEVLRAVAEGLVEEDFRKYPPERMEQATRYLKEDHGEANYREVMVSGRLGEAEVALTTYPLHPKVQGFFDQFVGQYGHSSIMELTGSPTVGVEGISWFTAWLLFDSPLVAGQEFSTRAVRHKNWPMARESIVSAVRGGGAVIMRDRELLVSPRQEVSFPVPHLKALHEAWLEVYEAEVAWWQKHLSDPENRAALGIGDKEPFRPALDRARWALPGTFATGAAFACSVRDRARALRDAQSVNKTPTPIWADVEAAYRKAVPGIAQYGLREAVIGGTRDLPGHLKGILQPVPGVRHPSGVEVKLRVCDWGEDGGVEPYARSKDRSYTDPWFNRVVRCKISIECSLAVARDWHRHRTLYPWHLGIVLAEGTLSIDRRYEPKSEFAIFRTPELLSRSYDLYQKFLGLGDKERAALALPLGTRVVISGAGGLRDTLYMSELRALAHGANFEYQQQAVSAMDQLELLLRKHGFPAPKLGDPDPTLYEAIGYRPETNV